MRALPMFVAISLVMSVTGSAFAIRVPSFEIAVSTRYATHVVLVSTEKKIDGKVTVLESWKGDLKKGDQIDVPELTRFADEKKMVVSKIHRLDDETVPAKVTPSWIVLFLIKGAYDGTAAGTVWLPAVPRNPDMEISIAWIQDDQVFAFAQVINPGPRELVPLGMKVKELKRRIDDIVKPK